MSFLGNVLWFIFGGLFSGLSWVLSGVIWCITIVGIPYGKAGNPIKEIRKRFSDDEINILLETKWWNWNIDKIIKNVNIILEKDVSKLKQKE